MKTVLYKIKDKLQNVISRSCNILYEKIMRKRLKNKEFSIVCPNCIGGVISHRLNQRFLSPTVNLWMHQKEFLKFVSNLPYYIDQELVFIKSEYDYPVAVIDDVRIYFNHSKTKEDAANDWNRRKNRIQYDNLYIIMYDRDGITTEDILKLREIPCKNKIVFSEHSHPEIDYIVKIKPTNRVNGQQYLDKDWFGFRTFEKQFDYVKWLNS